MSIFKCKMCGGDLEIAEGITIAECDYCGTKQTVPKTMGENLQNLFNRANTLRIKSEFDKAERLYEKIIQADTTQSEAYWGLILCKYGIEYVDDPATFKKIPTCHRASYDSIIADDDYKSALENADMSQRAIYEEQAKEIDRIQKEILALAQKEETYDVFICYKETDADGRRTQDSVIANDIYYQLTQEGFKVFYAAITLEGKLGSAYEPIIFAALNSAKVMLSIGTKPEYFNAVWVKNEWSRFLKIIKKDRTKLLIPCYRDMDAYELPEEFAHLQAQDMAKIGFINDLVRGIKKVIIKDEPKPAAIVKEKVVTNNAVNTAANITPLLKRAFMFLEDGEFDRADEFCEQVLNQDPECAEAYIGKLMVDLKVEKREGLKDQAEPFDSNNNYKKALRFADESLRSELDGYIEHINTRNENARLDGIYTRAKNAMSAANTENDYKEAAELFKTVSEYKDSAALTQMCYEKAEVERKEVERIAKRNKIIAIITTPIFCAITVFIIFLNCVIIPNDKYNKAIALMDEGNYVDAILAFEALDGYKDSANKISECKTAILDQKYNNAVALMDAGNLDEAYNIFDDLGDYKDSADKLGKIRIVKTKLNVKVGSYISFGAYEQDNDRSNGQEEIEWLVLEKEGTKALVVSKYALDCKPYNTSYTDVTWETCTLRKWLNDDFINVAFSADEKTMISAVMVPADENPYYSTYPGNATQDQVFLLSITEVNKYFSSDSARQCKPTDYAVHSGAYANSFNGNCLWWLRSPGYYQDRAADVNIGGGVGESGNDVNNDTIAVRPAMWIDLNS